jgi:sugar lactone lactonase YvrE
MKSFVTLVNRFLMLCFLSVAFSPAVYALSPIVQYQSLVAGEGEKGFLDGSFYSAQFNRPLGLALSTDGSILYVADQQNNRIRAVLLDQKNTVETLAGTGEGGNKDGPLSIATFN